MSFFFLHPLYLFGLAAASLPILIHLLNRRRMKRIRFPAVRFVLLSQKRISRSYRLRHWLRENSKAGSRKNGWLHHPATQRAHRPS